MRELSKLYTEPSDDPTKPTLHRYTLRGISTTKSTMYIRTQAEPDLIDMDLDSDQAKARSDQWWRISYSTSGANPVNIEVGSLKFLVGLIYLKRVSDTLRQKTTEEEVLEAAKSYKFEDSSSLLVYASDKAMSWERKPLPKALEVCTPLSVPLT